jgi:hypothetical protein
MKKKQKFYDYNVYVACSLTHAPIAFRESVEIFKDKLRSVCNVLCFLGIDGHPPHKIYHFDVHECVCKSDLVVAICDLPSIGLGMEIGTQIEARKMPCLAIAHKKSKVTDMIVDTRQPGSEFRRYNNLLKDGMKIVIKKLEEMRKEKRQKCFEIKPSELSRQRAGKKKAANLVS